MPKKMSKAFFVGGYLGGIVVSMILGLTWALLSFFHISRHPELDPDPALLVGAVSLFPLVFSVVVVLLCVHRMWAAMQDSYVRTTPGKAVGFLLVPIFNLYWMFHVFHGFAYDYNEYIIRHQLEVKRLDEQLFRTYPIMILCSFIPFVGGLALLASVVVLAAVMIKACEAVDALCVAQQITPQIPVCGATTIGNQQST